jgi:hypothetical protein
MHCEGPLGLLPLWTEITNHDTSANLEKKKFFY